MFVHASPGCLPSDQLCTPVSRKRAHIPGGVASGMCLSKCCAGCNNLYMSLLLFNLFCKICRCPALTATSFKAKEHVTTKTFLTGKTNDGRLYFVAASRSKSFQPKCVFTQPGTHAFAAGSCITICFPSLNSTG